MSYSNDEIKEITIFKKISAVSVIIAFASLVVSSVIVILGIFQNQLNVNNQFFTVIAWIFFIFSPLSVIANVIDKSVNKHPLSLISLFNLVAWVFVIAFVLGVGFSAHLLKG
ncbi:hypothetical protein QG053_09470 [Kingella kingae]|uniref:hypothetical protein n=1 Tax=Kingella kingae TaxID=504 RepID=UPI002551908C|nr:hypothetical protein [Kingella kingae]MDK4565259.1 hypothetical protein [Kingella kingae]